MLVEIPEKKRLPAGGIVEAPKPNTEQPKMITGGWRILRPVIDQEKCTRCLLCWIYCPEPCIDVLEGDRVEVNLKYCKGCGICVEVCPVRCITEVPELDFPDGVVRLEQPF